MAHIRKSYNDLEEKLREEKQAYYNRVQEHIEKHKKRDRILRIVWGVIGLILTILLVWMICRPDISREVRQWVTDSLMGKSNETGFLEYIFMIPESIWNMPLLLRLPLGLIMVFLRFLWSLVLLIVSPILGPILRFLMYAIPAMGPLILVFTLLDAKCREYSVDEEAEDPIVKALCDGRNVDILQAGMAGEYAALDCFAGLDDNCYIFTNLHIPHEGKESETDIVVVSPAGITIVEVKNHKGVIRGDASDHELIQDRGYGDEAEDKRFYNPIKQVATHAYRLGGYLRSKNLPIHIRTCVFFANPESELRLQDSEKILQAQCPVFHVNQVEKILRYLQSGLNQLTGREFDQSVKLLEQLMK